MKKSVIILLCVFAVIVAAGFMGYNIAVEYVENKMVSSVLGSMLDSGEITISELSQIAEHEDSEAGAEAEDTEEKIAGEPQVAEKTMEEKKETPKPDVSPVKPAIEEKEPTREETMDKATEKILNSISREDKRAMMNLITSHLSGADIKYLASLLAGGLTSEERSDAYRLAKQRFTKEELSFVSSYYHRYKKQIMVE